MGAVPGLGRGLAHTAPTYTCRDPGSLVTHGPWWLATLLLFLAGVLMDIADVKRQARAAASKRRAEAHELLKDRAGVMMAARGLPPEIGMATGAVSGFIPYKSEITTIPMLERLHAEGWRTCLPIVIAMEEPLVFRAWAPGEPLVPGAWEIPVPRESAPEVLPDVLLVPMLSFDRRGFRLGYGGGFYDRTLEQLRETKQVVAIGVAYHAQLVEEVPVGLHDAPLDYVMTEQETFACA